jgi:hypothetical protein
LSSFWLILKQQWTIKISSPLFSIFSLSAILVGSRDHRTQIWKGAIQGPFHQSLVQIGPVASEELIKMWKVNGWTTDTQGSGELKREKNCRNILLICRKGKHHTTVTIATSMIFLSEYFYYGNLVIIIKPQNKNSIIMRPYLPF